MKSWFTRCRFALALLASSLLPAALAPVQAQTSTPAAALSGQVLDQATQAPVPYASLGVLGRPVGTVADEQGRFTLALLPAHDPDTVRLSMVGYATQTMTTTALRRQLSQNGGRLYLTPVRTQLGEVVVRPGKPRQRVVGNTSNSPMSVGFTENRLGYQLAQGMRLRQPALLEQVSFHVARCTYDSLFYRVNVYQVVNGQPTTNLLPEAVYVRVRKGQLKKRLVADLRRFNLTVQGDIAVSLEIVKDLGPGMLALSISPAGGPAYVGTELNQRWEKVSVMGVGIDATVTEYR